MTKNCARYVWSLDDETRESFERETFVKVYRSQQIVNFSTIRNCTNRKLINIINSKYRAHAYTIFDEPETNSPATLHLQQLCMRVFLLKFINKLYWSFLNNFLGQKNVSLLKLKEIVRIQQNKNGTQMFFFVCIIIIIRYVIKANEVLRTTIVSTV